MKTTTVETLAWVLIYGGLLGASLGLFVQRQHDPIGWTLVVVGALAAVAGVVLIVVRSRMADPPR
jgi:F0F1-type ATP synthase assembly protein I